MRIQREVIIAQRRPSEVFDERSRKVNNHPARVTHEMGMTVFAQVVKRRPIAGVDVLDDAEFAEALNHSVDGRRRDAHHSLLDFCDEILCCEVICAGAKDGNNQPGWDR